MLITPLLNSLIAQPSALSSREEICSQKTLEEIRNTDSFDYDPNQVNTTVSLNEVKSRVKFQPIPINHARGKTVFPVRALLNEKQIASIKKGRLVPYIFLSGEVYLGKPGLKPDQIDIQAYNQSEDIYTLHEGGNRQIIYDSKNKKTRHALKFLSFIHHYELEAIPALKEKELKKIFDHLTHLLTKDRASLIPTMQWHYLLILAEIGRLGVARHGWKKDEIEEGINKIKCTLDIPQVLSTGFGENLLIHLGDKGDETPKTNLNILNLKTCKAIFYREKAPTAINQASKESTEALCAEGQTQGIPVLSPSGEIFIGVTSENTKKTGGLYQIKENAGYLNPDQVHLKFFSKAQLKHFAGAVYLTLKEDKLEADNKALSLAYLLRILLEDKKDHFMDPSWSEEVKKFLAKELGYEDADFFFDFASRLMSDPENLVEAFQRDSYIPWHELYDPSAFGGAIRHWLESVPPEKRGKDWLGHMAMLRSMERRTEVAEWFPYLTIGNCNEHSKNCYTADYIRIIQRSDDELLKMHFGDFELGDELHQLNKVMRYLTMDGHDMKTKNEQELAKILDRMETQTKNLANAVDLIEKYSKFNGIRFITRTDNYTELSQGMEVDYVVLSDIQAVKDHMAHQLNNLERIRNSLGVKPIIHTPEKVEK